MPTPPETPTSATVAPQERAAAITRLGELIADIPVAMLATHAADHTLHSRPMVNINNNFQGELWFFTPIDDPKVEEIRSNPQVNVAFAAPNQQKYVSVTGSGTTLQDAKRRELLWNDECARWFPGGPDDQDLALIKIEVERAEYWDASRNSMVAVAGFIKSMAGGDGSAKVEHETLDWKPEAGPPGASV